MRHHYLFIIFLYFLYFRADLIQYEKLSKSNAMYNLNHAFDKAENEFGLVKLLDAEVGRQKK